MSNKRSSRRFLYHKTDYRIEELLREKEEDRLHQLWKRQRKREHIAWSKEQRAKEQEKYWREQITQWALWSDISLECAVFDNKSLPLHKMTEALDRSEHSKTWRSNLKKGIKGGHNKDVFPIFIRLIILPRRREMAAERRAERKQLRAAELERKAEAERNKEKLKAELEKSNRERQERIKQQPSIFGEVSDSSENEDPTAGGVYVSSSSETSTPDNLNGLL